MMDDKQEVKCKVVTGFFWRVLEKTSSQVAGFIISIILARLLLPSDYGIIAMTLIFLSVADVLVTSGFSSALVQKIKVDDVDFSSIFWAELAFSIIIYVFIFFVAPYLSTCFDNPLLGEVFRVLGIRLPLGVYNSIQQAYVTRAMRFKKFFYSTLLATLLSGLVGVYFAYEGIGVWALVIQNLTSLIITTLVLFFIVPWRPQFVFSMDRFNSLIGFGWRFAVTNFIGVIFNQIRSFVIGLKYTSADLAYYNRGEQIPSVVETNIENALISVLFPAFSRMQDDPMAIKNMLRKTMRIGAFFIFPIMLGILAIAHNLVLVILTDKWMACIPFIQAFCVNQCIGFLGAINLQTLNGLGRVDISLKLEFIKKPIFLCVILLTMGISPLALVFGGIVYNVIVFIINSFPNRKLIDYKIGDQIKDVIVPFVMAIIMSLVVLRVEFTLLPIWGNLVLQILIGIAVYVFLAYIFMNRDFMFIKEKVVKIRKGENR